MDQSSAGGHRLGLTPRQLSRCVQKKSTAICRAFYVVLEGFEPPQAEPESDVLPLHHKTISSFDDSGRISLELPDIVALQLCCKGKHYFNSAKFFADNFKKTR